MPSKLINEPTNNPLHINNNNINNHNNNNNNVIINNNKQGNEYLKEDSTQFLCHIAVYYRICYLAH